MNVEKITTKSELIDRLKDMRAVEIIARDNYKEDVITFENLELKDIIGKIKIEEDRHINILEGLIRMLKK